MGKNLKRQSDAVLGTPGGASRQGGKPPVAVGGKRHKQMSLVPFLRTPAHLEETPALHGGLKCADISSTGLQKLGQLNIRTQQKKSSSAATTQPWPTVSEPRRQDLSPADDNDFFISMSQTYERTQPDACNDYGLSHHEDVEPSQRCTQHYHPSSPLQHCSQYRQSKDDGGDDAHVPAFAFATSTATEAWEASLAEAKADPPTVSILRPPEPVLEGQGSNKLLDMVKIASQIVQPAELHIGHGLDSVGFWQHHHYLHEQQLQYLVSGRPQAALPAATGAQVQTPEMLAPGCSAGAGDVGRGCGDGSGSGVACTVAPKGVADDGTTPPLQIGMPLFPIFNQPKARRRPIHLIRHGESEYNLACRRHGGFGDPNDIFDARLTLTGQKQARALRPQLLDLMRQHGDPLFIVSPLSRAIETFLHMLPDPERLRVCPQTPPPASGQGPATGPVLAAEQQPAVAAAAGKGVHGSAVKDSAACGSGFGSKPLSVMICPFLSEILLTSGDVGRPRSLLIESYPQLAEELRRGLDKERWWYENASRGRNCAINRILGSTEPDKIAKARVDRFRQFVYSQPHRPIVVVGHANFFRTLTHDSHYMANCQMTTWTP